MLQDHLTKEPSKSDMARKVEAYKTLNSVLVKANSEFMDKLGAILTEKTVQHDQLKEKLEKGEGTEEENATFIYIGGYIQCLKDILGVKPKNA